MINLITENLRVGEIRYSALPIEYPPTSEQGIAIVFNIESWESYDAFFDNVYIISINMLILNFMYLYTFYISKIFFILDAISKRTS